MCLINGGWFWRLVWLFVCLGVCWRSCLFVFGLFGLICFVWVLDVFVFFDLFVLYCGVVFEGFSVVDLILICDLRF